MRPRGKIRSRLTAMLWSMAAWVAVGMTSGRAQAGALVVTDGLYDVEGGRIRVEGDCCASGPCTARFQLDNTGTTTVTAIKLSAGTLVNADGQAIGPAAISFSPPGLPKLGPTGVHLFTLDVAPPAGAAGGLYHGVVIIRANGVVELEAPLEVSICAPPTPSLRLVAGLGQLVGGRLAFAPEGDDCRGGRFTAEFVVEADGNVPLTAVRPSLGGLPAGAEVTFEPEAIALLPGERGRIRAAIRAAAVAPGKYTASLVVADPSGARGTATADLEICPDLQPGIAIVAAGDLNFASGAAGCAGGAYRLAVTVRNSGAVELAAVEVSLDGLPIGGEVAIAPASVGLGVGEQGTFAIDLTEVVLTGTRQLTVTARDTVSGVTATAAASLDGCPRDEPPILGVTHVASRSAVQVGGIVTFTVTVTNHGGQFARDLVIEEILPIGWEPVAGRSALDGVAAQDPMPGRGGQHVWSVARLAPGATTSLRLQTVVTPAARLGRTTVHANARAGAVAVGPVDVTLDVTRQYLRPFGTVRGSVRFEAGGPVTGARVLIDSNLEVETGADGRFQFDALSGGEHLVSLDGRSLAAGESLRGSDSALVWLFSGATEEVEFVVAGRPRLGLHVEKLERAVEE